MKRIIIQLCSLSCFLFLCSMLQAQQVTTPPFGDLNDQVSNQDTGGEVGDQGGELPRKPAGGGSGGGGVAIGINIDWPTEGKILENNASINWRAFPSEHILKDREGDEIFLNYKVMPPYKVEVKEYGNDGQIIFTAITDGNSMSIPIEHLSLDKTKTYVTKVSCVNSAELDGDKFNYVSKEAKFTIVDDNFYHKTLATATSSADYAKDSKVTKLLKKAFALKVNGLNLEALSLYKTYMESSEDNKLLRKMRDNFRKDAKISCLCQ